MSDAANGDGASTGTATTAASPSSEPSTLPSAVLIGAVVVVAAGGAIALAASRVRQRPAGRHSA